MLYYTRLSFSLTLSQYVKIPYNSRIHTCVYIYIRYVRYKQTSLEKNYKYEVLTEHDLGVTIDLINPEAYTPVPNAQLHPTDEKLLEDDILTPQVIAIV